MDVSLLCSLRVVLVATSRRRSNVCVCVCVCVCLIMRDLENSKTGGLDPSWAVAPQKKKNEFI